MGHPASPFIDKGKARVIEEEKGEERERQEGFQGCRVLLLLHTGPADPVDVNRDGHTGPSSAGHGVPLCPGVRRGELTRLSASVRGLGRTALARPTLQHCGSAS